MSALASAKDKTPSVEKVDEVKDILHFEIKFEFFFIFLKRKRNDHAYKGKCKTAQWIILVASLEAIIAMWDTEMHNLFSNCL